MNDKANDPAAATEEVPVFLDIENMNLIDRGFISFVDEFNEIKGQFTKDGNKTTIEGVTILDIMEARTAFYAGVNHLVYLLESLGTDALTVAKKAVKDYSQTTDALINTLEEAAGEPK